MQRQFARGAYFSIAICLALASHTSANAQADYPAKNIRLVVPFAPGGVNDAAARPLADRLKSGLGTIVIENVGGAGGAIGAAMVAKAAPDGYTLLLGGGATHVLIPLAASRPTYDAQKDFEPIVVTSLTAQGIVVHPGVPANDLKQLIAYAKANAAKLSYASPGVGSPGHLAFELFKSLVGAKEISHVPYRGAGPALNDVVAGHVPLLMPSMTGQVIELANSGKIRLLAVTSPGRLRAQPDLPTAVEAGLPGLVSQSFVGLYAPAGTPRPIIDKIAAATRAVVAEPEFQKLMLSAGFEPVLDSDPAKARAFVLQEMARWGPVIKSIGLVLQ